jgi:hypothetical protein
MHSITQEELIQYLYGETSPQQNVAIKAALQTDWQLMETYQALAGAQEQLGTTLYRPRKKSVDFILQYAGKQVKEISTE